MRSIKDVVNQMKDVCTNEEVNKYMDKVVFDSGFTAPERMNVRWGEISSILISNHKDIDDDELVSMFSILSTNSEDVVRKALIDDGYIKPQEDETIRRDVLKTITDEIEVEINYVKKQIKHEETKVFVDKDKIKSLRGKKAGLSATLGIINKHMH